MFFGWFFRHKKFEQPFDKVQKYHVRSYIFSFKKYEIPGIPNELRMKKSIDISDNMAGQVLCYHPVTIEAMEPFWQDCKFTHDRFVGIGNAPGIRATNESDNN